MHSFKPHLLIKGLACAGLCARSGHAGGEGLQVNTQGHDVLGRRQTGHCDGADSFRLCDFSEELAVQLTPA